MGTRGRGAKQALVKTLGDRNDWVRWYAIEALGNMGGEAAAAVDALLPLLEHQAPLTRRRAIEALGQIRPPAKQAAAALVKARDHDADKTVREAAVTALYQVNLPDLSKQAAMGTLSTVRELMEKLRSGDQFAALAAAKALGEMGPTANDAVPALALALRDKHKTVREAAAKALSSVGSRARNVVPALRAAAHEDEPEVRAAAQKALDEPRRQVALRKISTAGQAAAK